MDDTAYFLSMVHADETGRHTIGQLCSGVFAVDNPDDAERFYRGYVAWLRALPDSDRSPEQVAQANIGWMFGEGMDRDRIAMWSRTVGAAHPVFGTMTPTTEALAAGVALAAHPPAASDAEEAE